MRPHHALRLVPCLIALPLPAQEVVRPRPEVNVTNGVAYQRGTSVSAAPRVRGIADAGVTLPPRTGSEVWTSKLVHHAWGMEAAPADRDVYYTRSTDGGITWASPRRIDAQTGNASEVTVVARGHQVMVTWLSDELGGGREQVYALISADQGATFRGPFLLNDPQLAPLGDVDEHWTAAAADGFFAVWEFDDRASTDEDVRFVKITVDAAGNVTVGNDVRLNQPGTPNLDDVDSPIVVGDPASLDVAVLWFDDRGGVAGSNGLYGVWSRVGGLDFPPAADSTITAPPTANLSSRNNVRGVLAGGRLHVVFEDRRNQANGGLDEPFYNRVDLATGAILHAGDLNLGGWTPPGRHEMDQPFVAVNRRNPDEVICCWHDDRDAGGGSNNAHNDVFYRISRDGGVTFTPPLRASATSGPGTGERNECWGVAWSGDHVVIFAERSAGNVPNLTLEDVLLFLSQDGGRTWSEQFVTEIGSTFATPGLDIDNPFGVMTGDRHDIAVSFLSDVYAGNGIALGGLRVPYVALTNPFLVGNPVAIQVRQIAASHAGGIAFLLYQNSATGVLNGFLPFGNGVDVDVLVDGTSAAMAGLTPLTVLPIGAGGMASTPTITVPRGAMPGRFRVQAVILDAGLRVRETSDPFVF